jgi:hypothetical protein
MSGIRGGLKGSAEGVTWKEWVDGLMTGCLGWCDDMVFEGRRGR